jgi:hypothetical protein
MLTVADAEQPLYESLDGAQKRRFSMVVRFAAQRHMARAHAQGGRTADHAGWARRCHLAPMTRRGDWL